MKVFLGPPWPIFCSVVSKDQVRGEDMGSSHLHLVVSVFLSLRLHVGHHFNNCYCSCPQKLLYKLLFKISLGFVVHCGIELCNVTVFLKCTSFCLC